MTSFHCHPPDALKRNSLLKYGNKQSKRCWRTMIAKQAQLWNACDQPHIRTGCTAIFLVLFYRITLTVCSTMFWIIQILLQTYNKQRRSYGPSSLLITHKHVMTDRWGARKPAEACNIISILIIYCALGSDCKVTSVLITEWHLLAKFLSNYKQALNIRRINPILQLCTLIRPHVEYCKTRVRLRLFKYLFGLQ